MPPIRTEPEPATFTATETDAPVVAASHSAPAARGFQAWLPLIVTILLMPVLAYAMTNFVILPRLQAGLNSPAPAPVPAGAATVQNLPRKKAAVDTRKESVLMNKLLVNVAGTMGSRYLLVSLSMSSNDPEFKSKVQELEPQLRDIASGTLAAKTLADLEKPGARNLIRTELISGFNSVLGGPIVQEVYLTEFAIQ